MLGAGALSQRLTLRLEVRVVVLLAYGCRVPATMRLGRGLAPGLLLRLKFKTRQLG